MVFRDGIPSHHQTTNKQPARCLGGKRGRDGPARATIHRPTLTLGLQIQGTLGTPMGDFGRFSCLVLHENLPKSPIGVPKVSLKIRTAYKATDVTKILTWGE